MSQEQREMARRAHYQVHWSDISWTGEGHGYFVCYRGPDPARRALRDVGPYDNEADAWARAVGLAMEYRDGQ